MKYYGMNLLKKDKEYKTYMKEKGLEEVKEVETETVENDETGPDPAASMGCLIYILFFFAMVVNPFFGVILGLTLYGLMYFSLRYALKKETDERLKKEEEEIGSYELSLLDDLSIIKDFAINVIFHLFVLVILIIIYRW